MRKSKSTPTNVYLELAKTIRHRFDTINELSQRNNHYFISELIAYHARKILESIGYLALISHDHKFSSIPKECKGKYKPHEFFKKLSKENKGQDIIPTPCKLTKTSDEEYKTTKVRAEIKALQNKKLTIKEIEKMYNRMSNWSHELNPFRHTSESKEEFFKNNISNLKNDVSKLREKLEVHTSIVGGVGIVCRLWDKKSNQTVVLAISKE